MFTIKDEALVGTIEVDSTWVIEGCRIYSSLQAAVDAGETTIYTLSRHRPLGPFWSRIRRWAGGKA